MKSVFPLFCVLVSTVLHGLAEDYKVGVGKADITPPLQAPLAGYYYSRGADGVLDPLFSKAIVIARNGDRIALVTLDLIGLSREITHQARAEIESKTGIPGSHIMISATHAHTGPELANRGRRGPEIGSNSPIAEQYTDRLPALIAESVRLANDQLLPAQLSFAKEPCENLTFNRRYFLRDGSVGWNPGKLNESISMPAGPTDSTVSVVYFEKQGLSIPNDAIGTYVNFAMHPDTTGGTKISADWPGALARVLAAYHGPSHFAMVANGACGNLNHVDVNWRWPQGGPGEQNRIATILGASVFQAYKHLTRIPPALIHAAQKVVELPTPQINADAVEKAEKALAVTKDDSGTNFMNLVKAYRVLDIAHKHGEPDRLEIQVLSLGREVAWVGLPGEIFVELGLSLKKRSPFPMTLIAELANENIGYVPDKRSFAEGNYEPESARCTPGSGEKLVEAALDLLQSIYAMN